MIAEYPYGLLHDIGIDNYETPTDDQVKGLEYIITQLPERTQQIINLRYKDYKTYKYIADMFNITPERIRQIIGKTLRKFRYTEFIIYTKYGYNVSYGNNELAVWYDKAVDKSEAANLRLNDSRLSVKTRKILGWSNFETMGDVAEYVNNTPIWWKHVYYCGKDTAREVMTVLEILGLVEVNSHGWYGLDRPQMKNPTVKGVKNPQNPLDAKVIDAVNLSTRAYTVINKYYDTIGDVLHCVSCYDNWYAELHGCGRKSALEIMNYLKSLNLVDDSNPGWEGLRN